MIGIVTRLAAAFQSTLESNYGWVLLDEKALRMVDELIATVRARVSQFCEFPHRGFANVSAWGKRIHRPWRNC